MDFEEEPQAKTDNEQISIAVVPVRLYSSGNRISDDRPEIIPHNHRPSPIALPFSAARTISTGDSMHADCVGRPLLLLQRVHSRTR